MNKETYRSLFSYIIWFSGPLILRVKLKGNLITTKHLFTSRPGDKSDLKNRNARNFNEEPSDMRTMIATIFVLYVQEVVTHFIYVTYYIKWVTTSLTDCNLSVNIFLQVIIFLNRSIMCLVSISTPVQ